MPAQVEVTHISKAFVIRHNKTESLKSRFVGLFYRRYREERETLWALRDVSLTATTGEVLGLVGRNGSGKSTLLKVIAGIYAPTYGTITMAQATRVGSMIELGVGFHPELTGKENIFLSASIHGLKKREIERIYPSVVEFSELEGFMDVVIKNYSAGMHARLGFALAAKLDPDLLLVDEILAVGDEAFQKKCLDCMERLRSVGKAIIFVSHNPELVKSFCDRACLLEHGSLIYEGKPGEVLQRYHESLS